MALSRGASVVRLSVRLCGCTVALLTRPSLLGFTAVIVPMDHWRRGVYFSRINTTSPTCALRWAVFHLFLSSPMERMKVCPSSQKWSASFSILRHRLTPYAPRSSAVNWEGWLLDFLHPSSLWVSSMNGDIGWGSLGDRKSVV